MATVVERDVSSAILDLSLPDVAGLDILRQLRNTSGVPVIILFGRGAESDRIVGLDLGADGYVVKPFSPGELSTRVRSVLRRATTDVRSVLDPRDPHPRPSDAELDHLADNAAGVFLAAYARTRTGRRRSGVR